MNTSLEETLVACNDWHHSRDKAHANPFSNNFSDPEVLEAKIEWEKERNETALLEKQRFDAGELFDYEPNFYAWCAEWTKANEQFRFDPVSGERSPIYVLCATANYNAQCPKFKKVSP